MGSVGSVEKSPYVMTAWNASSCQASIPEIPRPHLRARDRIILKSSLEKKLIVGASKPEFRSHNPTKVYLSGYSILSIAFCIGTRPQTPPDGFRGRRKRVARRSIREVSQLGRISDGGGWRTESPVKLKHHADPNNTIEWQYPFGIARNFQMITMNTRRKILDIKF